MCGYKGLHKAVFLITNESKLLEFRVIFNIFEILLNDKTNRLCKTL